MIFLKKSRDFVNFSINRAEDDPSRQTLWSFSQFLECAGEKSILAVLESGITAKFLSDSFDEGLIELVLLYCKHSSLEEIVKN